MDALLEQALAYADRPRSNAELAGHLGSPGGHLETRDWWWAVRVMAPFIQAAGHVQPAPPWAYGRRPTFVAARSWLPRRFAESDEPGPDSALDALVLRYLAGFGPATVGDLAQFTRLERSRLRASADRLRPRLRVRRDTEGRELLDVPDGALPDPDVPAPVRFLPMWDSVLLAYEDRARLIPPEHRTKIIRSNGDVLPTFLVDGRVAGVWRAQTVDGRTTIRRHDFQPLPGRVVAELEAEAQALARFVEPYEPEVYRRYARWWERLD